MGYIDVELGIKSSKGLEIHLKELIGVDVMVVKLASSLKIIWAVDSKLHYHNIKASVIYVVQEYQIDEAVEAIVKSVYK